MPMYSRTFKLNYLQKNIYFLIGIIKKKLHFHFILKTKKKQIIVQINKHIGG